MGLLMETDQYNKLLQQLELVSKELRQTATEYRVASILWRLSCDQFTEMLRKTNGKPKQSSGNGKTLIST